MPMREAFGEDQWYGNTALVAGGLCVERDVM